MKYLLVTLLCIFVCHHVSAKVVELSDAIKLSIDTHPSVEAAKSNFALEDKSVTPLYFPDNPMIGIMKENGMKSWTVSQELLFPTKYFHRADAQSQKALAASEEVKAKKLEIRQKVISAFYTALMQEKTVDFLNAQRYLLREIARIAEGRRATGNVTAQDEMKAHLEQSRMEKEILLAEQDLETGKARIAELFGTEEAIQLGKLSKPALTVTRDKLNDFSWQNAPTIKSGSFQIEEAAFQKTLAKDNFLPDLKISAQSSIEKVNGNNDKIFAFELKFPLWFWAKESGELSAANAKLVGAKKTWESDKREWQAEKRSLLAKIIAKNDVLKLYETTLIPQATSTITSSRSAYQAGRVNFIEILDSERTAYSMQISYYQELKDFCEAIAEFESMTGQSISTLPFGDFL